jgi:hypothetical protein
MVYDLYHRYPVCIRAQVFVPGSSAYHNCIIRNLSEGGALISTVEPKSLHGRIYLKPSDKVGLLECEVRWRSADRLFGGGQMMPILTKRTPLYEEDAVIGPSSELGAKVAVS